MRARLQQLADRIRDEVGEFGYRVFTDSAPVLEVAHRGESGPGLARQAHAAADARHGLVFLPGRNLYEPAAAGDGPGIRPLRRLARACIGACPTGAIVAPYELDARRCISYLTIELPDAIPEDLRPLIGNRVYGCDDCQLACPWNRFAQVAGERDFAAVRHGLDRASLVDLFAWTEEEFRTRMEGSAIRRIGYERWLRNLAVGLGNAPWSAEVVTALERRADDPSPLVREHVAWALTQQNARAAA